MRTVVRALVAILIAGASGRGWAAPAERAFTGIGAQLKPTNEGVMVERVIPGSGAEKSGLPVDCFKGFFQMEDHPDVLKEFRGAVGFIRLDFQFGDQLRFRSRFNFYDSGDRLVDRMLVRKTGGAEPAPAGGGR